MTKVFTMPIETLLLVTALAFVGKVIVYTAAAFILIRFAPRR